MKSTNQIPKVLLGVLGIILLASTLLSVWSQTNNPPVADAGPDKIIFFGDPVTIDASRSYDPDGDPITYEWVITSAPPGSALAPGWADACAFSYVGNGPFADGYITSFGEVMVENINNYIRAGAEHDRVNRAFFGFDVGASGLPSDAKIIKAWYYPSLKGSQGSPGPAILDLVNFGDMLDSSDYNLPVVASAGTFSTDYPVDITSVFQTAYQNGWMLQFRVRATFEETSPYTINQYTFCGSGPLCGGSTNYDPPKLCIRYVKQIEGSADTFSFTPDVEGEYTVQLMVNDGTSDSAPDTVTVLTDGVLSRYSAGGQRGDVNDFITFASPQETRTNLPYGITSFPMIIIYGSEIMPETFEAFLNSEPFYGFNPVPRTGETVTIPLTPGSNTLLIRVQGVRSDGRIATDRDRLVFIVQ